MAFVGEKKNNNNNNNNNNKIKTLKGAGPFQKGQYHASCE